MLLTVSKRLEFSASRRLHRADWTNEQNLRAFGDETNARYGAGRNYVVWLAFTGTVDRATGMLMNISEIKRRAGKVIDEQYDHRFLNEDNAHFSAVVPTVENVARQLAADVAPLFADSGAQLSALHLEETPARSATAYVTGVTDANFEFRFSAARITRSPHLSEAENERIFGRAASAYGHGHDYRVRLTSRASAVEEISITHEETAACLESLTNELDHRNLNVEVEGLRSLPMTTEMLAQYVFRRASASLPMHRVRLYERSDFFAEFDAEGKHFLGMQTPFSASHRLQSYEHSPEENNAMYGKCNNPAGHGHLYVAEATIGGALDERSGTLGSFADFQNGLRESVAGWNNHHLDLETKEFLRRPSTGENIVQTLWEKANPLLWSRLVRLRLWETANNRFTIRRVSPLP